MENRTNLPSQKQRRTSRLSRYLKEQFGGSDLEMIFFICILVTIASVVFLLLGWVKSVKDEKVETNATNYREYMKRKNKKPQDRGPASDQLVF